MSRHNAGRQLKLPKELLDKVGGNVGGNNGYGRRRGDPQTRKEQRRNDRVQKRTQQRQPNKFRTAAFNDGRTPIERARLRKAQARQGIEDEDDENSDDGDDDDEQDPFDISDDEDAIKFVSLKDDRKDDGARDTKTVRAGKDFKQDSSIPAASSKQKSTPKKDEASPPPRLPRREQAALDNDDAEIAALEKKLGMKGSKKLGKAFDEDGLTDLLEDLSDGDTAGQKRKRAEYDDYLLSKRQKASRVAPDRESDSEGDLMDSDEEDLGSLDLDLDDEDGESDEEGSASGFDDESEMESDEEDGQDGSEGGFDGFSDEEDENTVFTKPKEDPYRPPIPTNGTSAGKYVPPSMRGPPSSDAEAMQRLKRQLQGLLNRLSEANLLTILKDIEQVFASNPRQYVTETLIDLLISLVADRTALNDTFIILHAGFIAAVYKVVGAHFGAQLLERLVETFSRHYEQQQRDHTGSKEATNLIALMAELYTFQVIGSQLLFDYLRLLLAELSDLNTELLLKIIKNCGPQLRHDDPSALKDIVIILQKAVTKVGEDALSVRTKFMIETINNLKNNRQKTGVAASQIASEHTTRMKKTIGTLNTRSLQTSEPLGVSLADIKSSSKQGKWWLVGASWKNEQNGSARTQGSVKEADDQRPSKPTKVISNGIKETGSNETEPDLNTLARALRINTDIRRAIFTTLLSATDYKDCATKLTKLHLKKSQESEIARVLILCAAGEKQYNPYYTVVAKRLCNEKRGMRVGLQFGLWEAFKRMGETGDGADDDEDDDDSLDLRKIVNLAKMFADIIADGGLSLSILKVLDLTYLQSKTQTFLEVLLVSVLQACVKKSKGRKVGGKDLDEMNRRIDREVTDVFGKVDEAPQMAKGLQYFMDMSVKKSDLDRSKEFKRAYQMAVARIQIASSAVAVPEDELSD